MFHKKPRADNGLSEKEKKKRISLNLFSGIVKELNTPMFKFRHSKEKHGSLSSSTSSPSNSISPTSSSNNSSAPIDIHQNPPKSQLLTKSSSIDSSSASFQSAGSRSSENDSQRFKRYSVDELLLTPSVCASNLRDFLQTSGKLYFRRFLESEFAQENLNFYEKVQVLKDKIKTSDNEVATLALSIYSTHVISAAPEEVNLPYEIRQQISQQFDSENATHKGKRLRHVFDLAQECILEMLSAESFRRFTTHSLYADYLKDEKEEGRRLSDPSRRSSFDSGREKAMNNRTILTLTVDRSFSSRSFYL